MRSHRVEYRRILSTSLPLMAYYFSEAAIGLTDLYIVGRLGANEVAAVGLGRAIGFGWLMLGFGVLSIVSVLASEALARRRFGQFHRVFVQGIWLALGLALISMAGIASTPALLTLLGYDPLLQDTISEYLSWLVWMLIPGLWFALARNFLTVLNRSRVFLLVSAGAVLLNFLLNHILVFGRLGLPAMGVAGAGLATVLVSLASLFCLMWYIVYTHGRHVRAIRVRLGRLDLALQWRLIRLGSPVGAMQFLESAFFILIGVMVGMYGATWLAAHNVMQAAIEVNFVIALSIGEALSIRVAWHRSRNNPAMVRRVIRFGLGLAVASLLVLMSILFLAPQWVIGLFIAPQVSGYDTTVQHALVLAAITLVLLPFDTIQVVLTWVLRGARDTLVPVLIATGGYWLVGLGLGALLSFGLGFGVPGIWWGFTLGLGSAGLLLVWRARRTFAPGRVEV